MCIYYKFTDFDGCFHSVPTELVHPFMRTKAEYCSKFVEQWVRALIADMAGDDQQDGNMNADILALDSRTERAERVHDSLAPCPDMQFKDSPLAVRASIHQTGVSEDLSLGPVCNLCSKKYAQLEVEWDELKQLLANINANIARQLYDDPDCQLSDGCEVPLYLRRMTVVTPERIRQMDAQRNQAFAQTPDANVFVTQQWLSLRHFQRRIFYRHIREQPLDQWSERGTNFGRMTRRGAWAYLNRQLRTLFVAQNMDHVDPDLAQRPPRVDALIEIDIPMAHRVLPRPQAELNAFATLNPRIDAAAVLVLPAPGTNAFSAFPEAVAAAQQDDIPADRDANPLDLARSL